jgi:hypothetical protein
VLDESDRISTELLGVGPGRLGPVATMEAARLAALSASVEQLKRSAPDENARLALGQLQEPLRGLHSSVDAVALAPVSTSELGEDGIGAQAAKLHSATSLARAALLPSPPHVPGPPS